MNYTTYYQRLDKEVERIQEVIKELREIKYCDKCDHMRNTLSNYSESNKLEGTSKRLNRLTADMRHEYEEKLKAIHDYEEMKAKVKRK
jgi:hypothetical protein